MNKHYPGVESLSSPEFSYGTTWQLDNGLVIVRLRPGVSIGCLAHELFHAISNVMDWVGMKLSQDSEEAYAYLFQDLFNYVYENLKR